MAALSNGKLSRGRVFDYLSGKTVRPPQPDFVRKFRQACIAAATEDKLDLSRFGTEEEWLDLLEKTTDEYFESRVQARRTSPKTSSPAPEAAELIPPVKEAEKVGEELPPPPPPPPWRSRWLAATLAVIAVGAIVGVRAILDHGSTSRPMPHASPRPWSYLTRGSVDGSPVISGNVLYAADDRGVIYALNVDDGKKIWTYRTHSLIDSTPCVDDGTLYVGNHRGNLYAISVSGKLRWMKHFAGGIDSSPVADNGVIYFGDGNNNLDAVRTNGTILWHRATGQTVMSSPAIDNGVVYVGSEDDHVYAFTASHGKRLWRRPTGGEVDSSPTVANGLVYIGSDDGYVYAFHVEPADAKPAWMMPAGGAVTDKPLVYGGAVYVGSADGKLYSFDANSGARNWSVQLGRHIDSSPSADQGIVFVGSSVNASNGSLSAVTVAGKVLPSRQTGGEVMSSPVIANGYVYIGSDNNEIIAVRLSGYQR